VSVALLQSAGDLLDTMAEVHADEPDVLAAVEGWRQRLREPLRLGIAGMVKAGKSTLLNALIGERIAPTDAGECTRVVTWYRYGATPQVVAVGRDGQRTPLALQRRDQRLEFDLRGLEADELDHIDVRWPSPSLRSLVLIDTPGIESVSERVSGRSLTFLTPGRGGPTEADAIVYLLRHLHPSDLAFLQAFRDSAAGDGNSVNALAVLSRADEVGSGRLDALLSARGIAARYRENDHLRALALTVIPVAGLIAESARTLREQEFAVLREIAGWDRDVRDRLLRSADRFVREGASHIDAGQRAELLDRFGITGIRLGVALVRGGARTSSRLAEQLVVQSGLEELRATVRRLFRSRAAALKVRALLEHADALVRDRPRQETEALVEQIERLRDGAHELRELDLLARARIDGFGLAPRQAADAERILGADGTDAADRLGLPPDASLGQQAARIDALLGRWRQQAGAPGASRAEVRVCGVILRTLEGLASEVGAARGGRTAADVDPSPRPASRRRDQRDEQRQRQQGRVGEDQDPQRQRGVVAAEELEPDDAHDAEGHQRSA